MKQKEPVSRQDAIEKVVRVIKIPLATASRPMREEALSLVKEYKITVEDLINFSYNKLLGT